MDNLILRLVKVFQTVKPVLSWSFRRLFRGHRLSVVWGVVLLMSILSHLQTRNGEMGSFAVLGQQTIPPASSVISDDFSGCILNSAIWTSVDPVGDTKIQMLGQELEISVPEGQSHDVWTDGNRAPRIMQSITDTNFETEVKFESTVEKKYQLQGLIVEQNEDSFLRINVQSNGTEASLLLVAFDDGIPDILVNQVIPSGGPIYLRLLRWRALELWRVSYSYDGMNWTTGTNFEATHSLIPKKIGIFAGNAGVNPAFSSRVDYFRNQADEGFDDDRSPTNQLDVAAIGNGKVTKEPSCGHPVTISAEPDEGWIFQGWTGALTSEIATVTLSTIPPNAVAIGTFVPKPFTVNIHIIGDGQVVRSTSHPFYDSGDEITMEAIASPGWSFEGWDGDWSGSATRRVLTVTKNHAITAVFRPTAIGDSNIQSDDFNQCGGLQAFWEIMDPVGDAIIVPNGEQLVISVPEGTSHDIWNAGIGAPYISQTIDDSDFGIEVKYDSTVDSRYQLQGILVVEDDDNLLRFNFQHDGTSTAVAVVRVRNGTPLLLAQEAIVGGDPLYMRLIRTADTWSVNYSHNGTTWETSPELLFVYPLAVTKVGAFVGNAAVGTDVPPAHLGRLDYFFNMAEPIANEDANANYLHVDTIGSGKITKSPTCGNPINLTAVPDPGWKFVGWSNSELGSDSSITSLKFASGDSAVATFEPEILSSTIGSDVFNACAIDDTTWTSVDPLGDATIQIVDSQHLEISVPAGSSHDIWTGGIEAPHVLQAVNNADFGLDVKYGSAVAEKIQMQGVLIKQDDDNLLRLNMQSGSAGPEFLAVHMVDGIAAVVGREPIAENALYNRIIRSGDDWTISTSSDGLTWTNVLSLTHDVTVSQVGLFAGNAGAAPAFTAKFDYIMNESEQLIDEISSGLTLSLNINGNGEVQQSPLAAQFSCGEQITLEAIPKAGWSFSSWNGEQTDTINPLRITMNSSKNLTANFTQDVYTLQSEIIGQGTVSVLPVLSGYLYDDSVAVVAVPETGWRFLEWRGDLMGVSPTESIVIRANTAVTATFTKPIYNITVLSAGEGGTVSRSKTGNLTFEEEVTLSATAFDGWIFAGWTENAALDAGGILIATEREIMVTVRDDTHFFANFRRESTSPSTDPTPMPDSATGNTVYMPITTQ